MSAFRIAVLGSAVPGIDGVVIAPADVAALTFAPGLDAWSVTTGSAGSAASETAVYDLLVVTDGEYAVSVPQLDPRVTPPDRLSGADFEQAYRGMLLNGVPNLVLINDDPARRSVQVANLTTFLGWMYAEGATRITSRPPVTAQWVRKGRRIAGQPSRDSVDLSNEHLRDDGVYAGPATLRSGDTESTARVRLSGHLEPLDGNYHWYGIIDDVEVGAAFKKMPRGSITVAIDGGEHVAATVTDKTVWGTFRLAGVGNPPFPL